MGFTCSKIAKVWETARKTVRFFGFLWGLIRFFSFVIRIFFLANQILIIFEEIKIR